MNSEDLDQVFKHLADKHGFPVNHDVLFELATLTDAELSGLEAILDGWVTLGDALTDNLHSSGCTGGDDHKVCLEDAIKTFKHLGPLFEDEDPKPVITVLISISLVFAYYLNLYKANVMHNIKAAREALADKDKEH